MAISILILLIANHITSICFSRHHICWDCLWFSKWHATEVIIVLIWCVWRITVFFGCENPENGFERLVRHQGEPTTFLHSQLLNIKMVYLLNQLDFMIDIQISMLDYQRLIIRHWGHFTGKPALLIHRCHHISKRWHHTTSLKLSMLQAISVRTGCLNLPLDSEWTLTLNTNDFFEFFVVDLLLVKLCILSERVHKLNTNLVLSLLKENEIEIQVLSIQWQINLFLVWIRIFKFIKLTIFITFTRCMNLVEHLQGTGFNHLRLKNTCIFTSHIGISLIHHIEENATSIHITLAQRCFST